MIVVNQLTFPMMTASRVYYLFIIPLWCIRLSFIITLMYGTPWWYYCDLSAWVCDWFLGTHEFCAFNFILKIGCDNYPKNLWPWSAALLQRRLQLWLLSFYSVHWGVLKPQHCSSKQFWPFQVNIVVELGCRSIKQTHASFKEEKFNRVEEHHPVEKFNTHPSEWPVS